MPGSLAIWLFLLATNVAAFGAFGLDKQRARQSDLRIAERNLLLLAALGGTGGAYLGRWHFRHKTKKTSFSAALHLVAVVQAAFLIWFVARA